MYSILPGRSSWETTFLIRFNAGVTECNVKYLQRVGCQVLLACCNSIIENATQFTDGVVVDSCNQLLFELCNIPHSFKSNNILKTYCEEILNGIPFKVPKVC